MKPEFVVDRELIEQLLVTIFGANAQYLAHTPRDANSYTVQVKTRSGKYRFVVSNETLINSFHNQLTQEEINHILADSDPVSTEALKNNLGQPAPSAERTNVPKPGSGCLGIILLVIALTSLFLM